MLTSGYSAELEVLVRDEYGDTDAAPEAPAAAALEIPNAELAT